MGYCLQRIRLRMRIDLPPGVSAKGSGTHALPVHLSEENIRQWTFAPAAQGHSAKYKVLYMYRLEGKEQYHDSTPSVVFDLPARVTISAHPPKLQP